jgi:predicted dehydrogenase
MRTNTNITKRNSYIVKSENVIIDHHGCKRAITTTKMTQKKIGVGIIGLSTKSSTWAASAHEPALRAIDGFEIRALTASTIESAEESSKKYNVPHFFVEPEKLSQHPEVDLVVVSVRVPEHFKLVQAALNAGKMVYCEWPLGATLEEAIKLDALAKEKDVKVFVGLQARASPAVNYIKDLVQSGYVGEVLSTTVIGSGLAWGDFVDSRNQYLYDKKNGATLLSIPFGHTIDALCSVLGEFSEVTATTAIRKKQFKNVETNEVHSSTSPDQVAVTGVLQNGAVAAIHYRGGVSRGTNFHWEINGTTGDLVITANNGHLQMAEVTIKGASGDDKTLVELPVPAKYIEFEGSALLPSYAISHAYSHVLSDIRNGTHLVPNFTDAVLRHRMLEAIEKAAETGQRQSYNIDH